MRIRSASTLIFLREQGEIVGYNYLTKKSFSCSQDLLSFLEMVDEWTPRDALYRKLPTLNRADLDAQIDDLIAVTAILAEESSEATQENRFSADWDWGVPAALFHLSVQDRPYMSIEDSTQMQRQQLNQAPQPALFKRAGDDLGPGIGLPVPQDNQLFETMANRRTVRSAGSASVDLNSLSDCLYAGLGITGFVKNPAGVSLPLGMTPSGGARNPFEAFVYARSVDGLAPGFYHYSAYDHELSRVATNEAPAISQLLGGQDWSDDMPVVVLLCAYFERSMWKYKDANAYRVLMIEAGHIGQNFMLAATEKGLCACPSAALDHALISRCVGFDDATRTAPIYALTLAHPGIADPVSAHTISRSNPAASLARIAGM